MKGIVNTLNGKTPFFRLLLPVIAGIIISEYTPVELPSIYISIGGIIIIFISYFIPVKLKHSYRWLFGVGIYLLLVGLSISLHKEKSSLASADFPTEKTIYKGIVTDIPQEKTNSVRGDVQLIAPVKKKVVLYFQKNDDRMQLHPGAIIMFRAQMQPFKSIGDPGGFNYNLFMKRKGFAGTAYIPDNEWINTGEKKVNMYILSQQLRLRTLQFFETFGLNTDQHALISSITLGYKDGLTDNVKEAFNVSGTSHVLAVSGMNVAIVYLIINSLLFFLGGYGVRYNIKQVIIILFLIFYAFVTGLSPSVVRAAIMLVVFCLGNIVHRRGFSYNTLAIAAFFILIVDPMCLFDVGFQLSFTAVFSILYFKPIFDDILNTQNKLFASCRDLLTISLSAQLGVFPIVLFYFGTFPTYFFITNIVVVPLIGMVTYIVIPVILLSVLNLFNLAVFDVLFGFGRDLLSFLNDVILKSVYLFESLPYAQLTDHKISLVQVILILIILFYFPQFLKKKSFNSIFFILIIVLSLCLSFTYENLMLL